MTNVSDAIDRIPGDIARAVVLPESYADEAGVYAALKWLRANMPLGVAEVDGYDPVRVVTRHADIVTVERQPDLFHSGDCSPMLNDRAGDDFIRSMNNGSIRSLSSPVFMDPPEHGLYRQFTNSWLQPRNLLRFSQNIREMARESVDDLLAHDGECDAMADFALHYPLRVIMSLLGIPRSDEAMMLTLTQQLFGNTDPDEQRGEMVADPIAAARQWQAVLDDFFAYFNDLRDERRKHPRDDIISILANAKVDGVYIPDHISNGYYVAIATAGHDTTSTTAVAALAGLAQFPDQFALLKQKPSLTPSLVEEAVRWACPLKHFMRSATADTELAGQPVAAGERLFLSYPSGCRDEAVIDRADEFVIDRRPNRHIGFGYGPHMCLGMHLARLDLTILFEELMPRIGSLEMLAPPRWIKANFVGSIKSLPIRFSRARAAAAA